MQYEQYTNKKTYCVDQRKPFLATTAGKKKVAEEEQKINERKLRPGDDIQWDLALFDPLKRACFYSASILFHLNLANNNNNRTTPTMDRLHALESLSED